MQQYLKSLLPRLQQFSKTLDHLENFIDKPWILIDEMGNRHTYIFQRDKTLIMSINGKAQIGSWNYIAAANSLLIDRGVDKILLNHAFISNGLMVLKLDGNKNEPWILANELVIPDLNIPRYLKDLTIQKLGLKSIRKDGKLLYYTSSNGTNITSDSVFYDENLERLSDSLKITDGNTLFFLEDGVVQKRFYKNTFQTNNGYIELFSKYEVPSVGDEVRLEGEPAPNEIYILESHLKQKSWVVRDGRISKINYPIPGYILPVVVFFLLLLGIFFYNKMKEADKVVYVPASSKISVSEATVVPDSIVSVSYTTTDSKNQVADFLTALNNRDFSKLEDFFPEIVPKYYNDWNLSRYEVIKNIENHYESFNHALIIFDVKNMKASEEDNGFVVETTLTHRNSRKDNGIPTLVFADVKFILSSNLKISNVTGKTIDEGNDYELLLIEPQDDNRSWKEFIESASVADFDNMFDRLSSGMRTTAYKMALKDAIILAFGENVKVYNINTRDETPISLDTFCHYLITGIISSSRTKEIYRSTNGELASIDVSYY